MSTAITRVEGSSARRAFAVHWPPCLARRPLVDLAAALALGAAALSGLPGCAPTASVVGGSARMALPLESTYEGPKARIAVARFEDKTAKGYDTIGEGMATMFTTALVNSSRFVVLERDIIGEVITEQDLSSSGRISPGTGAPTGEIIGAELLLTGAVTEYEPDKFGLGGGVVGLGTLIGSALLHDQNQNIPVGAATFKEAHIAIDVRLVDTTTSRVLAALSVEATGQDWGGFVAGEVGGGKSRLPLAFGGFQNAAVDKAVRKAVNLAVAAISHETPAEYYRHTDESFSSGRIVGFSYVEAPGISGERYGEKEVRVARSAEEWSPLAADLGLPDSPPPVDFSDRQIVAVAAPLQAVPGRSISIERVVGFGDRVEIRASLLSPPAPEPGEETKGGASSAPDGRRPIVLLSTDRTELPVRVVWVGGS